MQSSAQQFPWLNSYFEIFNKYQTQNKIPHGLLLSGVKGVGKERLAHTFAESLLCDENVQSGSACRHCKSCLLLKADTHPDFFIVAPEESKSNISINQIRSINEKLRLKPQYHGFRVIIIKQADRMNISSANAFLKCLEEPAENTIIILVTDKPYQLPITITSRCQKLLIKTPDRQIALDWLKDNAVLENAEILLALAKGAPILALEYAQKDLLEQRNLFFSDWLAVFKNKKNLSNIAEQWCKADLESSLNWMTSWVTDLIRLTSAPSTTVCYNPDFKHSILELSKLVDIYKLYYHYDLLLSNQKSISTQVNRQLMFEEILIDWSQTKLGR